MELKNNSVLITGGSSGIGLEFAKWLVQKKNKVIICSRSFEKLQEAKREIPEIYFFQCDVSEIDRCKKLAEWVKDEHPDCNILVNNAAIVHTSNFYHEEEVLTQARKEIETNLFAPIALSKFFIPIIEQNPNPQIINISSGLAYVPRASYPFYNATKAALHSFTQTLRIQLQRSTIAVKEVFLPAVDTPWHKGNPPKIAIPVKQAVHEMVNGLEGEKEEIRVGKAKLIYRISRIAPQFAISKINSIK